MPNLRPSNVTPVVAIPPGLVDLAAKLAEELPARIDAAVNPRRVLLRTFLNHVNKAAECERRRVLNKGRGWERAELRATAAKAKHMQAASNLLPLVREIVDGQAKPEVSTPDELAEEAATIDGLLSTVSDGHATYRSALESRASMIRDELASRSAVAAVVGDEDDGEVG